MNPSDWTLRHHLHTHTHTNGRSHSCRNLHEKNVSVPFAAVLEEWGVDPHTRREFCDKVVELVKYLPASANEVDMSDRSEPRIPYDVNEAIAFVVKNEIDDIKAKMEAGMSMTMVEDKLSFHFAPFFRSIDRRTGESKLFPNRTVKEVAHNHPGSLCPFRGFTYQSYTDPATFLAVQWSDQPASFEGYVWEAAVAHWLEHSGKCLNCDASKTVRWIGGLRGRCWGDAVCLDCKALYEIKSRATVDKIHAILFRYGQIDGGSYLNFARHRRVSQHKFLLLVSRQPNPAGYHPVYGVKICTVTPKLSDNSFDRDMDEPYIGSCFIVQKDFNTKYVMAILPRLEVDASSPIVRCDDWL